MAIYETADVPVLGVGAQPGQVARTQRVLLRLQVADAPRAAAHVRAGPPQGSESLRPERRRGSRLSHFFSIAHLPHYLLIVAILFVGVALLIVDPLLIAMLAVPGVLFVAASGRREPQHQRVRRADRRRHRRGVADASRRHAGDAPAAVDRRVLFQAVLLLVVVAHPNQKSIFEWLHRFFLVGGSIAIGAALGRARRANAAVVAFLVLARPGWRSPRSSDSVAHGFAPAYPFGLAEELRRRDDRRRRC